MKAPSFFVLVALLLAGALPGGATEDSTGEFEELPELKASEILRPDVLQGPYHKVREEVPTYSGANQYTIDSQFGVFEADGNAMLLQRIGEINAIARLKEVSRGDEYKKALANAAKGKVNAAKAVVTDPVKAVTNVPKGIMKFMGRVGDTAKNLGKKARGDADAGKPVEEMSGFAAAKRRLAAELQVDPYSTNSVLQHELDEIAWASMAGGASLGFALVPIPGAGVAGTALTLTEDATDLEKTLAEKTPEELKSYNRKQLVAMGASASEADRLLNNTAFSPSTQTAFVTNLRALNKTQNRRAFVRLAATISSSDADVLFCIETAGLMRTLNKNMPLGRIETLGEFPICVAEDGTTVLALQWDYAAWTPGAANLIEQVKAMAEQPSHNHKVRVVISGEASARLHEELAAQGCAVQDRFEAGPLK